MASLSENAASLAEQKMRLNGVDATISRHEKRLDKLDEAISTLKEISAKSATKDDITDLHKDFIELFQDRLSEAHKAMPGKLAAAYGGGMFVIAIVGLVVSMLHR